MHILFIFLFLIISNLSAQAQIPGSGILMDCQKADKVAKIIFFRPFKPLGSAIGFELYLKDSLQAKLRTNSFFVMEVPSGKHHITSVTGTMNILKKKKYSMDLTIEPGKIYFVKCYAKSFSEGITKPNYKLLFKVLDKEELKKALKKKFLRKHIRENLYMNFLDQVL